MDCPTPFLNPKSNTPIPIRYDIATERSVIHHRKTIKYTAIRIQYVVIITKKLHFRYIFSIRVKLSFYGIYFYILNIISIENHGIWHTYYLIAFWAYGIRSTNFIIGGLIKVCLHGDITTNKRQLVLTLNLL